MKCASQSHQILIEDGMVASFTVVTVSLTVWVQLVYTLHCTSLFICSVHTFLWILYTATPILLGTDDSVETMVCPRLWASYTCQQMWCIWRGFSQPLPELDDNLLFQLLHCKFRWRVLCWNISVCMYPSWCRTWHLTHSAVYSTDTTTNLGTLWLFVHSWWPTKKIDDGSYGHVFRTINYSVIIKRFFITKFSNPLKQFFLTLVFSLMKVYFKR